VRLLADQSADLLITDVRMPGISGLELARQAKRMRPNLHIDFSMASCQSRLKLEPISVDLNREGDSQVTLDERFWRH
jgi:CheY-like chemotaxis protein